jgi:hypothetical protein
MQYLKALFVLLMILCLSVPSWAGPYSPGRGGAAEAGIIDAGIAGFLGPAGEGVANRNSSGTIINDNYLNPIFVGWATSVVSYIPSDYVGTYGQNGIGTVYGNPTLALGPVTGSNVHIASLGDMHMAEINSWVNGLGTNGPGGITGPGTLTLGFDNPIYNGPGADFAAFENGFVSASSSMMFAELGFVEVSTDGLNFATFPSSYLNYPNATANGMVDSKIDLNGTGTLVSTGYLTQDVSNIYNLVGKHANAYSASWGTPFDLDDLLDNELVLAGLVDLDEINYVRIVDIAGNGTWTDADGNPIYDAWVTWGSGGLDFEALGVINASPVPIPGAVWLLGTGLIGLVGIRRRSRG